MMRRAPLVVGLIVPLVWSVRAAQAPPFAPPARSPAGRDISWAFGETNGVIAREPANTPHRVPGSERTYTRGQIDDLLRPPDWFPEEHLPAPSIVLNGHGEAAACASCHLMSGLGHPESADLTGLSVEYFRRTTEEFRTGVRVERNHMNAIARELSDEEIAAAAQWFAKLKVAPWTEVREASVVPKTWVPRGRMRLAVRDGGTEPLGDRIVTLPRDEYGFLTRNPHTGFIAYVPVGSIARGKSLVTTGNGSRTVACGTCHGPSLLGSGNVPRLAGLHPAYIARQLYLFQDGRRGGMNAQPMEPAVRQLDDDDIVAISAYLASIDPTSPDKATAASASASGDARTTTDGAFTSEQEAQGSMVYRQRCASCHGSRLEGKEVAPAITGPVFLTNWTGLTVHDLFERIRASMPADNPGTLTREQVSQVVAFILGANKFRAGAAALSADPETLKAIVIESK